MILYLSSLLWWWWLQPVSVLRGSSGVCHLVLSFMAPVATICRPTSRSSISCHSWLHQYLLFVAPHWLSLVAANYSQSSLSSPPYHPLPPRVANPHSNSSNPGHHHSHQKSYSGPTSGPSHPWPFGTFSQILSRLSPIGQSWSPSQLWST